MKINVMGLMESVKHENEKTKKEVESVFPVEDEPAQVNPDILAVPTTQRKPPKVAPTDRCETERKRRTLPSLDCEGKMTPLNAHAQQCTAKSKRSGARCKNPAVKGYSVCRMHGARGGAPIGNKNGVVDGEYMEINRGLHLLHREWERNLRDKLAVLADARRLDYRVRLAVYRAERSDKRNIRRLWKEYGSPDEICLQFRRLQKKYDILVDESLALDCVRERVSAWFLSDLSPEGKVTNTTIETEISIQPHAKSNPRIIEIGGKTVRLLDVLVNWKAFYAKNRDLQNAA